MRRLWIACVALVLLSGCTSYSSGTQGAAQKQAFIRQLVGYCAQVDRKIATIDERSQPGQVAQQLHSFTSKARSHPPPSAQRQQFDILLTAIDDAAQQYQSAQTAMSDGNGNAYHARFNQAERTTQRASLAAQRYGMPPLADCAKVQGGPQQNIAARPVAGWVLASDSLYRVLEVGAAVLGGRIWVAGGLTGPESATVKTQFYDPTIGVWSPGPDLPVPLHHAMMVSYANSVWVIGGFQPAGGVASGVASARVLHLNQAQTAWVDGPALHHARAAGAAAAVGNEIVVAGGRTAGTSARDVAPTEVFNGTSWHDAADIPVPGDHLAAASDGRYLYAVGGRKLEVTDRTAAVQRFDPVADRWTQLPAMPSPVTDCGAAVVGGQLVVVGGESVGTVLSTVRAYSLAASTWSTLPSLAAARHGAGVTAIGSTLYAIDGGSQPGHQAPTSTVQTLTFHN